MTDLKVTDPCECPCRCAICQHMHGEHADRFCKMSDHLPNEIFWSARAGNIVINPLSPDRSYYKRNPVTNQWESDEDDD